MNRQQRRAAARHEANRQTVQAAPTEWADMTHRQRREATGRAGRR